MKEIWKTIKNYEGYYEVSNRGRVRSLDREITYRARNNKKDHKIFKKGKVLKHKYHNGYQEINLNKNGVCKTHFIHRLVGQAFVENPHNKNVINHKNGIKSDNRIENLEWVTYSENNAHALETNLRENNISGILKENIKRRKEVAALKDNKIVNIEEYSRLMAEWLIAEEGLNTTIETASRAIRASAQKNTKYYGYNFQFI